MPKLELSEEFIRKQRSLSPFATWRDLYNHNQCPKDKRGCRIRPVEFRKLFDNTAEPDSETKRNWFNKYNDIINNFIINLFQANDFDIKTAYTKKCKEDKEFERISYSLMRKKLLILWAHDFKQRHRKATPESTLRECPKEIKCKEAREIIKTLYSNWEIELPNNVFG